MTEQKDIIVWIEENLGSERGAKAKLARAIPGLDGSKLSKILSGERDVSGEELLAMAEHFGVELPKSETEGTLSLPRASRGQVPVVGRIGEDQVWVKPGEQKLECRWVNGIADDTYPIEDQAVYELAQATSDGEYRARDLIFTVPFSNYRARPVLGDEVVVLRELDGFTIFSLRRAVAGDRGITLLPMHEVRQAPAVGEVEKVVGLVIGFYRPKRPA